MIYTLLLLILLSLILLCKNWFMFQEKLSVFDFVDKGDIESLVPVMPPPLECTPFKLVEDVKGLKELAAKLSSVDEFAV